MDNQYKTVSNYDPPSDAKLEKMMNFKAVEKGITQKTPFVKWAQFIIPGILLIGLSIAWISSNTPKDNPSKSKAIASNEQNKQEKTNTEISPNPSPKVIKDKSTRIEKTKKAIKKLQKAPKKKVANQESKKDKQSPKKTQNVVIENLENKFTDAHPANGFDSLYLYFQRDLVYPLAPPADTIEGKVELQFMVDKNGNIKNSKVVKSLGKPFDIEALRVINEMPKWIPATVNGTPLDTRKQISINFKVNQNKPSHE